MVLDFDMETASIAAVFMSCSSGCRRCSSGGLVDGLDLDSF